MTIYTRAPQVAKIAKDLIRGVEEHKRLGDVWVEYLWRDKAAKSHGRIVLASARKVSGLAAYLAHSSAGVVDAEANTPLFVVEVAADTWDRLEDNQRIALVDHELCHLRVDLDDDGTQVLTMRGHDLEEFASVVERHGLWKADVAAFGAAFDGQLALAIDEVSRFLEDQAPPEGDES